MLSWDHPRGCGENTSGKSISAHARRITPADAGKTAFERLLENHTEDHPRGCGEN